MAQLNLVQRKILTMHNEFYGTRYQPATGSNSDQHVLTHKMCHLLKYVGITPGNYVFSLDRYGAYSEGLQADILRMDYNADSVQKFYESFDEEQVFSGDWRQGSLFSKYEKERITLVAKQLGIDEKRQDGQRRWMELLSTLAELKNSVLLGATRDQIESSLKALKKEQNYQSDEILNAWERLEQAGIFSNDGEIVSQ